MEGKVVAITGAASGIAHALAQVLAEHGFINLMDLTDEAWDSIIRVNLSGLMYCVRAQIRVMQSGAAIVNVSSYAGIAGRAGLGSYVASKHGVVGITKTAAREVGPRGVRVNAVAPGPIDTPMLAGLLASVSSTSSDTTNSYDRIPLQRRGQPEEVARLISFLLSDNASYINGAIIPIDGGIAA